MMGIECRLSFIKPALKEVHISSYRNKRVAVDSLNWLYKGIYSCAYELNNNRETHDFLFYMQKMINMLLEYSI